jgi:hypothetical protein
VLEVLDRTIPSSAVDLEMNLFIVDGQAAAAVASYELAGWPAPSQRPTTAESAQALEAATEADPQPRLPEVEITDGLGI